MSISEDEDLPQLSSETFAALQEFYKEQEEHEKRLELLASETLNGDVKINEDWQLSQFWYDDKTIEILVDVAIKAAGSKGNIALVSCPSLYSKLKQKADPTCDSAIMADLVQRLLDLKKSSFEPKHANNLANEFWCYTNFNIDDLL